MNDIERSGFAMKIHERTQVIGQRIAKERNRIGLSQGELADKVTELLKLPRDLKQTTVSNWECGKGKPEYDKLFALSLIFGCDCGYLLGDYEERTRDATDICKTTGLSERSVQYLSLLNSWGFTDAAKTIDFLLSDAQYRNKEHDFRGILDLLHFFFSYSGGNQEQKQVYKNGTVIDCISDDTGYLPGAIRLNDRIIENAVLMEIQQALTSLKNLHIKAGR